MYLAHNKVNFDFSKDLDLIGGGPLRRNNQIIWPSLEILDLTDNKCADLSKIEYLFSGYCVSGQVCRVVGVSGNRILKH